MLPKLFTMQRPRATASLITSHLTPAHRFISIATFFTPNRFFISYANLPFLKTEPRIPKYANERVQWRGDRLPSPAGLLLPNRADIYYRSIGGGIETHKGVCVQSTRPAFSSQNDFRTSIVRRNRPPVHPDRSRRNRGAVLCSSSTRNFVLPI